MNKTYKITIYDPDKVEINGEILNEEATMWKTYKDFKSEDEAKNWLLDHIEIVEMINYPSGWASIVERNKITGSILNSLLEKEYDT